MGWPAQGFGRDESGNQEAFSPAWAQAFIIQILTSVSSRVCHPYVALRVRESGNEPCSIHAKIYSQELV